MIRASALRFQQRISLYFLCELMLIGPAVGGQPVVETIAPLIVQRGETTVLEIVGAGFTDCRDIVFYSDGIRCSKLELKDEYTLTAHVEVDATCPVSSHAFRLLSSDGFSDLRTLKVSRFPVLAETERDRVDSAIRLPFERVTVAGVLEEGDYDRYEVQLAQGQRLTVEVDAMRLGGQMLDTVLSITDPDGALLSQSDDDSLLHQDPALSFVAATDGVYRIEVRESNYSGSVNAHYGLHIGDFWPTSVAFPPGGQLGTALEVQFRSSDGKASSPLTQAVDLPQTAGNFQLFPGTGDSQAASAVPFRLSNYLNALELEPNDAPEIPDRVHEVPIAFNGIIETQGDIDHFAFQANAGEQLGIEVFADRIGSPADTYLRLFDSTGRLLAQNDDWGSQDSRIEFNVPATGFYLLSINDKLNHGGANSVYRIEIEPIVPCLRAFVPRPDRLSQRQQTIAVPKGNRTLARVGVVREHIEPGVVQVRFADLPSGVHASPVFIAPHEFWALAILEADADAGLCGTLARVIPTFQTQSSNIEGEFEQVVDLIADSADRLYQAATVDRLAVAVTPAIPFQIELEQPQTALAVNGTIDVHLNLQRDAGFTGPVRIEMPYLPDGCIAEPFVVIESKQSDAIYRITASPQTEPGDFKLVAIGAVHLADTRERGAARMLDQADENSENNTKEDWFRLKDREVASPLIDLRVGDSPLVGRFGPLAAEQGQVIPVQIQLESKGALPARFSCSLEGLPNRVIAESIEIPSNADSLTFELKVPVDAPLGTFSGIQCRMGGNLRGTPVSFVVSASEHLMITEPGQLHRAADGRVLSPLEALREQNAK